MPMNLSRREIGLIYGLLQTAGDEVLERIPLESAPEYNGPAPIAMNSRLNKLIASNLRQKLREELGPRS